MQPLDPNTPQETSLLETYTARLGQIVQRNLAEKALRAAAVEAQTANRAKTEFLANMSHELRTPLNAIIGFAETMQMEMFGKIAPRYREYAEDIHHSGTHLLHIINDILDLSKIEAGKFELQEQTVDVPATIESACRIVRERADAAALDLRVTIATDVPQLWADERCFKQILLNLLTNAVKFTPAGGRIEVTAGAAPDGRFLLRVKDTGIGIGAEHIDRVLAPFEQVASAFSRKHEGSGLGLPLVNSLVRLHGGRLDIKSKPASGTQVTTYFPTERVLPAPVAEVEPA